jgi:hypothetical protein
LIIIAEDTISILPAIANSINFLGLHGYSKPDTSVLVSRTARTMEASVNAHALPLLPGDSRLALCGPRRLAFTEFI